MDEHKEEGGLAGNCEESVKGACEEVDVPVKAETLGAKVDVQVEDCNGDTNTTEGSDSGVCNSGNVGNGTGEKTNGGNSHGDDESGTGARSLEVEAMDKDNSVSWERKEDVGRAEEMGVPVDTEATNATAKPETDESERDEVELKGAESCDGDERGEKPVALVESEVTDERENGETDASVGTEKTVTCVGTEVTDEKPRFDAEDTKIVDAEISSDAAEIMGSEEKEPAKKGDEDKEKMDTDNENTITGVMDEKASPLHDEQKNPESETVDATPLKPVQALEEPDQVKNGETAMVVDVEELKAQEVTACDYTKDSFAVETCPEELTADINQKEEKEEAMEIDSVEEGQVKEVDKFGGFAENAGEGSDVANTIETRDVPTGEANQDDSSAEKKTETDKNYVEEQDDKDDTAKIISKDSTDPDNLIEDASTGNNQEIRSDTGNVTGEENTEVTGTAKEVATLNDQEGLKPDIEVHGSTVNVQESVLDDSKGKDTTTNLKSRDPNTVDGMEIDREGGDAEKEPNEAHVSRAEVSAAAVDRLEDTSDANLGSSVGEENQEEKGTEEQKDMITEQEGDAYEAPDVDTNQMQDTEMAEKLKGSDHDEGTDSDTKTNGVKRKADALGEDSSQEVRKTISVAKVSVSQSHPMRSSFKIGACIARAASQMAGPPSVLKGSTFSDDLSVDNFLSQLQSAATDPVKENAVSEIAAGFFLDYRNSVIPQQPPPDKVSGKRGRPSNSNIGGTEAFEFEEMSDTYWNDRVVHNGGEEQKPPAERGDYQVVPVELKPAQIQRTRRPYTKRKHAENNNNNNSVSASNKPAGFDENSPAELIMSFSEMDTIPSEVNLNKMLRHFGPIRESQTEVDRDTSRARVIFRKCGDAEVAYNSAGRFNIFGSKVVNYELSYTITEPFKIQPYVVTIGEEDGALCLPSQS
ncbi:PREDICTED: protein starmaker-like isoform X2 [Tarenaya hassleriana]|uniref:protein starmaker-like isoform X2 n=1 Tax=Tarenaya hassleriana TaxID=28532 RepID=UPI00053C9971|nr:PREDICTED: protein starmaker-like isoform X2 [Tarenaya hassleriana]